MYRRAVTDADLKLRDFAVDSMLLRASIAHLDEWAAFAERLTGADEYIRRVSWLGRNQLPFQGTLRSNDSLNQQERQKTVLWLIEHYPDAWVHQHMAATLDFPGDEAAHDVGKSSWLKNVVQSPTNVRVLSNAAHFCKVHDPVIARELLLACVRQEPEAPRWPRQLAKLTAVRDISNLVPEPSQKDLLRDAENNGGNGADK
jgi:hypothetical protein